MKTSVISLIAMPTLDPVGTMNDTKMARLAILAAINTLNWKVESESEGQFDVVRRDHNRMATIRITYHDHVVGFQYLGSKNFSCEPSSSSCTKIHRVYGQWVHRLRSLIKHELELAEIPPDEKQATINSFTRPVHISKVEPGSNFKQIGPISGRDGKGCGLRGRRGTYEAAVTHLKQVARQLDATYVQIIQFVEPHQSSKNCFDNEFQIRALAFKEVGGSQGIARKIVGSGSCFSVSPAGLVLTNYHVVNNAHKITVRFEDKTETTANIAIASPEIDLALLRLKTPHSAYLTLAGDEILEIGQEVFTLGYPVPDLLGDTVKHNAGTISAKDAYYGEDSLLQISVPIQPGNSGGPLVTNSGNVVGVVTSTAAVRNFYYKTGALPQNVNFAVKTGTVRSFFKQPEVLPPALDRNSAIERAKKAVCQVVIEG